MTYSQSVPVVNLDTTNGLRVNAVLDCGLAYSFSIFGSSNLAMELELSLNEFFDPLTAQVYAEALNEHHGKVIEELQATLEKHLERAETGESPILYHSQVDEILKLASGPIWEPIAI